MKKNLLRGLGIFLIVISVILIFGANDTQKAAQPSKVSHYIVHEDGTREDLDTGYLPGNPEVEEGMGTLKILGFAGAAVGVISLIASFKTDD